MIPIDKEQVRLLEQRLRGIGVDRRTFMKIAGAAMAALVVVVAVTVVLPPSQGGAWRARTRGAASVRAASGAVDERAALII